MLFISHDLDVVEYLCDRIVVLYLGRMMEMAPDRRAVRARRCTPTPRPCSRPRHGPIPRRAARGASCRATSRARSIRRRAASSGRAARTRSTPAQRPCRRCGKWHPVASRRACATTSSRTAKRCHEHHRPEPDPCRSRRRDNQGLSAGCRAAAALGHRRAGLEPLRRRHAASAGGDPRFGAGPQPSSGCATSLSRPACCWHRTARRRWRRRSSPSSSRPAPGE